jgi:hypothetical protein
MNITQIRWLLLPLSICLISAIVALYAIVQLLAYIVKVAGPETNYPISAVATVLNFKRLRFLSRVNCF